MGHKAAYGKTHWLMINVAQPALWVCCCISSCPTSLSHWVSIDRNSHLNQNSNKRTLRGNDGYANGGYGYFLVHVDVTVSIAFSMDCNLAYK